MSGGWLKETRGTGERATVIIASCSTIIPFSYTPRAQLPDETESTRMNCLVLACARNYARVITRVRLRRARLPSVIVRLTSSLDSHCQPACLISVNHSRYAALLSTFKRRYGRERRSVSGIMRTRENNEIEIFRFALCISRDSRVNEDLINVGTMKRKRVMSSKIFKHAKVTCSVNFTRSRLANLFVRVISHSSYIQRLYATNGEIC